MAGNILTGDGDIVSSTRSYPLPFSELASPQVIQDWLYRLLLAILLPAVQPGIQSIRENQPSTVNTWFRAVERLLYLGNPAHWITQVVSSVLSGSIEAPARFPTKSPLPLEDSTKAPKKRTVLAPFLAEVTAAAARWCPALGLPVLTPPRDSVVKYEIKLEFSGAGRYFNATIETLGLLFLRSSSVPSDIRQQLADGKGDSYQLYSAVGMDRDKHLALVWMEKATMEKLIKEKWSVCWLRTDAWAPISDAVTLNKAVKNK